MMLAKTGRSAQAGRGLAAIEASFEQTSFQLDYLTEPTALSEIGLDVKKVDVVKRAQGSDEAYVIAYPYYNVNGARPREARTRSVCMASCCASLPQPPLLTTRSTLCCVS
jgi:hypothetical protein